MNPPLSDISVLVQLGCVPGARRSTSSDDPAVPSLGEGNEFRTLVRPPCLQRFAVVNILSDIRFSSANDINSSLKTESQLTMTLLLNEM
jgi:hypothetical protein